MKTTDISTLDDLYSEVESIKDMTEEEAKRAYNVDSKDEILAILYEEITALEEEYEEQCFDYTLEELEAERTSLCLSQGMARYC